MNDELTDRKGTKTHTRLLIFFPVFILITVFIILVLSAGSQKSETIDEGLFIAGGAAQVKTLNPNIDMSHPPLLRWISGISSVVFGKARVSHEVPFVSESPVDLYSHKLGQDFSFSQRFFYDSAHDHDRVLFWGRFPFVFFGALLGLIIFAIGRKYFGLWPAFGSLTTFLFIPEILAHSQWAHADLASTLTIFLISFALFQTLSKPTLKNDLLLAVSFGIAVSTKLTALIHLPFILILLAVFHEKGVINCFKRVVIIALVLWISIVFAYLPEPRLFGPHEFYQSDLSRLGIVWLEPIIRYMPLPDSFLKGVVYTLLLGQHGQVSFFHGEISSTGWWYYFPAAIFLKYPTGLLIVGIAGLIALWRSSLPLPFKVSFTFPPFIVLFAAMLQSVNIGVRSVLPVAPYLAFWCGSALWYWKNKFFRFVMGALLITSVLSGISKYPDFLTYFNPLFGGTPSADKWLVDSNLDWGQDLPALADELQQRDISKIRLAYFGMGKPSYYGIEPLNPNVAEPGWYAISRSYLSGWWPPGDPFGWLRSLRPVTYVGGSIALFHVDEEDLALRGKIVNTDEILMKRGLDALYTQNDYKKAARYFRKVLEISPGHYGATFQLAMALDRLGRHYEAKKIWENVLKMARQYNDEQTAETAQKRIMQNNDQR
jgi:hypothetical protein